MSDDHSHDDGHSHDHGHSHDDHGHSHDEVSVERAPRGGPVVMDIGGDIGGLIVRVDDSLEGTEIPIESLTDPTLEKHTGVWRRPTAAGSVVVAVFSDLHEGTYRLAARPGDPLVELAVIGGQVTELDLRTTVVLDH
jgi:ABC-type Zn2+ transport system substrate-binding protein/surface adhesin